MMLFKMLAIQRIWQQYPDTGPKPRQVYITQSRVLALKAEEGFAKLMPLPEADAHSQNECNFIDQDDNQQWRSDLPERFSELLDDHFPLFITYDRVRIPPSSKHPISPFCEQLCTVIQNDIVRSNYNNGFTTPKRHVLGDEVTSPTTLMGDCPQDYTALCTSLDEYQ